MAVGARSRVDDEVALAPRYHLHDRTLDFSTLIGDDAQYSKEAVSSIWKASVTDEDRSGFELVMGWLFHPSRVTESDGDRREICD